MSLILAECCREVHSTGKCLYQSSISSFGASSKLSCRLIFDNVTNPLTQAQAAVTSSIVAGAIFHNAQQNGLQSTFDLPNGFLDLTNTLYVSNKPFTSRVSFARLIVGFESIDATSCYQCTIYLLLKLKYYASYDHCFSASEFESQVCHCSF